MLLLTMSFRHSIVASIPACHVGDRGSIPRDGDPFFASLVSLQQLDWKVRSL
jgi:hypothetical protein